MYNFTKFIKGLLVRKEGTLTPSELAIVPNGTDSTRTTLTSSQTVDRTVTLPDAATTLLGTDNTATVTNKTIDADLNTITNIANDEIKAAAAIALNKLAALDANVVPKTDASGFLVSSATTATELSYLEGVLGPIQDQLDDKASIKLDNLDATTEINVSLLPASPAAIDLGSALLPFNTAFVQTVDANGTDLTLASDESVIVLADNLDMSSTKIINLANPTLAQDAATKDYVDDATADAANNTLSNLVSPTSINEDLIPANSTINLGSQAIPFGTVFTDGVYNAATLGIQSVDTLSLLTTSGDDSADILVSTGQGNLNSSGNVLIKTGNSQDVSGNIDINTGTSVTGEVGNIYIAPSPDASGIGKVTLGSNEAIYLQTTQGLVKQADGPADRNLREKYVAGVSIAASATTNIPLYLPADVKGCLVEFSLRTTNDLKLKIGTMMIANNPDGSIISYAESFTDNSSGFTLSVDLSTNIRLVVANANATLSQLDYHIKTFERYV